MACNQAIGDRSAHFILQDKLLTIFKTHKTATPFKYGIISNITNYVALTKANFLEFS